MGFTHLHVHSEYSMLDGLAGVKDLIRAAHGLGMNSLALTDHGNLFGAVDFYNAAIKRDENDDETIYFDREWNPEFIVKPIIGCEVYIAPRTRFDKTAEDGRSPSHLVLLVKDEVGYKNLSEIVSNAYLEGSYYKPRTDMDDLRTHYEGLIALSGCIAGEIPARLLQGNYDNAKKKALEFFEIFGEGNFYIEIQDQGLGEERRIRGDLIRLSRETGIPLVATNDIHYIKKTDADTHDVLLCVQTNATVSNNNRMRFQGDQFYMRSEEEMRTLFRDIPEALDNTEIIARKCNYHFALKSIAAERYRLQAAEGLSLIGGDDRETFFPAFPERNGMSNKELLRLLCKEGMESRYGDEKEEWRDRLEYELSVIEKMGFVDYFLIVWDFIRYAKERGIAVGPGRGSAAGSIVAYVLGITELDPMRYGLLFERFLNPERKTMPDIDVDICTERREEVIDYVRQKYGLNNVAHIITFGTMQAKGVIKDIGRALCFSYGDTDRLTKAIPIRAKNLAEAYAGVSKGADDSVIEFKDESKNFIRTIETPFVPSDAGVGFNEPAGTKDFVKLMDYALNLEGKPRQPGTHASGIVISKEKLSKCIPLYLAKDQGTSVQYTMNTVEDLQFLKMDLLGLRNLTLMSRTIEMIEENKGVRVEIDSIKFDDPNVYALIGSGETEGVFQLEQEGMQGFMRQLKPKCFEEIFVGISMYRPGPMKDIPEYLKYRRHPDKVKYMHPLLEPILSETYGVMVYQEQVMRIVRDLAGFSYGQSDEVRRNMSKKDPEAMLKTREAFVDGCVSNGITKSAANRIFDHMVSFASYAFNKSHAAVYSVLTYQTAFLKTYFKEEFMAALMSSVMDTMEKVVRYIRNARDMGITVLPPDILKAQKGFSVSGVDIVMGLQAVKNVGAAAIDAIIDAREKGSIKDIYSFVQNIDSRAVNKRAVESLIFAGAFDSICASRAKALAEYTAFSEKLKPRTRTCIGQISLFDPAKDEISTVPEFPIEYQMEKEKEMLGMYFTAHPLDSVRWIVEKIGATNTFSIKHDEEENEEGIAPGRQNEKVVLVGLITNIRLTEVRSGRNKGRTMAICMLEDFYGEIEIVFFSDAYEKNRAVLVAIREDEILPAQTNRRIVAVQGEILDDTEKKTSIRGIRISMIEDVEVFLKTQEPAGPKDCQSEIVNDRKSE